MAIIDPVVLEGRGNRDFLGCVRLQYRDVKAGDTCAPIKIARYSDRSVQVSGTYSGATVAIQGTCEEDTNYATMTVDGTTELTFSSGVKSKFIMEATAYTKPVVTAGDGSTSVTITFMCRGQVA